MVPVSLPAGETFREIKESEVCADEFERESSESEPDVQTAHRNVASYRSSFSRNERRVPKYPNDLILILTSTVRMMCLCTVAIEVLSQVLSPADRKYLTRSDQDLDQETSVELGPKSLGGTFGFSVPTSSGV